MEIFDIMNYYGKINNLRIITMELILNVIVKEQLVSLICSNIDKIGKIYVSIGSKVTNSNNLYKSLFQICPHFMMNDEKQNILIVIDTFTELEIDQHYDWFENMNMFEGPNKIFIINSHFDNEVCDFINELFHATDRNTTNGMIANYVFYYNEPNINEYNDLVNFNKQLMLIEKKELVYSSLAEFMKPDELKQYLYPVFKEGYKCTFNNTFNITYGGINILRFKNKYLWEYMNCKESYIAFVDDLLSEYKAYIETDEHKYNAKIFLLENIIDISKVIDKDYHIARFAPVMLDIFTSI